MQPGPCHYLGHYYVKNVLVGFWRFRRPFYKKNENHHPLGKSSEPGSCLFQRNKFTKQPRVTLLPHPLSQRENAEMSHGITSVRPRRPAPNSSRPRTAPAFRVAPGAYRETSSGYAYMVSRPTPSAADEGYINDDDESVTSMVRALERTDPHGLTARQQAAWRAAVEEGRHIGRWRQSTVDSCASPTSPTQRSQMSSHGNFLLGSPAEVAARAEREAASAPRPASASAAQRQRDKDRSRPAPRRTTKPALHRGALPPAEYQGQWAKQELIPDLRAAGRRVGARPMSAQAGRGASLSHSAWQVWCPFLSAFEHIAPCAPLHSVRPPPPTTTQGTWLLE